MHPGWHCGHSVCEVREVDGLLWLFCINVTDCNENCECREREVSPAEMKRWNVTVNQRFYLECDDTTKERRTS